MEWASFLTRALTGGADEMTGDNLVRQVVDGIVALRTRGRRGASHLPAEVEVVVTVNQGSLGVVRSLIDGPGFEEEIGQRLLNRLVEVPVSAHPLRQYRVVPGEKNHVQVREVTEPVPLELVIRGGSRDGQIVSVPTTTRELRVGRGPLHGTEHEENDLVVTDEDTFVSRRAARLRRLGGHLRVKSLDQGESLAIVRPSGERIRPHRTIERWAPVRPGDRIELFGAEDEVIALELRCTGGDDDVTESGAAEE